MAKAPDLLLRFDSVKHAAFLRALLEFGITFNGIDLRIPQGTLIAIEVEASSDDASNLGRSLGNNLEKDIAAGLTVIVFACMPKALRKAKTFLASQDAAPATVILIDSLKLLDALKKESTNA